MLVFSLRSVHMPSTFMCCVWFVYFLCRPPQDLKKVYHRAVTFLVNKKVIKLYTFCNVEKSRLCQNKNIFLKACASGLKSTACSPLVVMITGFWFQTNYFKNIIFSETRHFFVQLKFLNFYSKNTLQILHFLPQSLSNFYLQDYHWNSQ